MLLYIYILIILIIAITITKNYDTITKKYHNSYSYTEFARQFAYLWVVKKTVKFLYEIHEGIL